jgi:NADH-quinone oxidoreductase subunit J
MLLREAAFWLFVGVTGLSALFAVTVHNVVHAALGLAASLVGAAVIFILLGAEFVGLAQILIYVGAVVILFLFGIMLTSAAPSKPVTDNRQAPLAALVAGSLFLLLSFGVFMAVGSEELEFDVAFPIAEIGTELFTNWILPFEAVSVILLAALIGAIVLARRD